MTSRSRNGMTETAAGRHIGLAVALVAAGCWPQLAQFAQRAEVTVCRCTHRTHRGDGPRYAPRTLVQPHRPRREETMNEVGRKLDAGLT